MLLSKLNSNSSLVRVRCVAQGHLDTQLGGAGDASLSALPPELRRPKFSCLNNTFYLENTFAGQWNMSTRYTLVFILLILIDFIYTCLPT